MKFKVNGKEFVETLNNIGGSKQVINFTVMKNRLVLQAYEPVVVDEYVSILSVTDIDRHMTISAKLNASYNIIANEDVEVTISDTDISFDTQVFHSRYSKAPIQRIDMLDYLDKGQVRSISKKLISDIVSTERPMTSIAKSLRVNEPAVNISDGYAYLILSSVACRVKTELPNCVLSLKAIRAINDVMGRHNFSNVNVEMTMSDGSYGIIDVPNVVTMMFSVKSSISTLSQTINSMMEESKPILKTSLASIIDGVRILQTTFKQIEVLFTLSQNGPHVYVQKGPTSTMSIGRPPSPDMKQITIRTNIVVMSALTKIFGQDEVEFREGGKNLCCQQGTVTLLMAGIC